MTAERVETLPFLAALSGAGERVTEPRRLVARLIARREGPFTAASLVDSARRQHVAIGRATVFRTLELFTSLRTVERLDLPSGEHAYVRCETTHHHHVVCTRCGRTREVEACALETLAAEIDRSTGYRLDGHRLALYGLCPACQRAEGSHSPAVAAARGGNA